ncbi:uncharacterized protein LOC127781297 [Oryza glaberrima]|uniref:uncharacterized protein LOC127781297 n=1 Tax=Oryza glaberrima TaxID=4538 RepID=UPI00224C2DE3|nr:uncharacterized protein LOC127781297 [Oryza glaberrima]
MPEITEEKGPGQQETESSDTIVDIDDLRRDWSRGRELLTRNKRSILISSVNKYVRSVHPSMYEPYYVPIGPYHYKAENNRKEEKCASYASLFSKHSGDSIVFDESKLARCKRYLNSWDAYEIYDLTNTKFSDGKTIELLRTTMLFDSCYVLDWLASIEKTRPDKLVKKVERDILYLLENQIPFTLLREIYTVTNCSSGPPLEKVLGDYIIERVLKKYKYAYVKLAKHEDILVPDGNAQAQPIHHLLHLLHMYFAGKVLAMSVDNNTGIAAEEDSAASRTPPLGNKEELHCTTTNTNDVALGDDSRSTQHGGDDVLRWRRATEYHAANVKFKPRELTEAEQGRSVIDMELRGSTLMMPVLTIDWYSVSILRNLIALEQESQQDLGFRVTAYCTFLSEVAGTPEDVALLSRSGVIKHIMTNDATCAEFFSKLRNGVVFDNRNVQENYLLDTCHQLGKHVDSKWSNWMATLWHIYLNNPWAIISLVVATILLVCSIVQTVYTAKGK